LKYKFYLPAWFLTVILFLTAADAQEIHYKSNQSISQAMLAAVKIDKPINFCGESVPINDPEIQERMERELLYALNNKDDIILWLKRANRYFPHIENILKQNSLPDDLKFIAVAESALKPHASSYKGAVGYWQFIESTGTKYNMEINANIDERRNFFTSTEAAVKYLKDLYNLFGSWTLAVAAYNMGEAGLETEILIQKVNNYYQLYLPQETQRYIFRILTAKMIMTDPEKYGFFLAAEDLYQPLQYDLVEISVNEPVPISLVAQAAKTYFKVIKYLNPHIRNYTIPVGKQQIMIPKGAAKGFSERYKELLRQWLIERKEHVYTIKKGDNLSNIALRFNVPVKAIMIWNGMNNGKIIQPGNRLVIYPKMLEAGINSSTKRDIPAPKPSE